VFGHNYLRGGEFVRGRAGPDKMDDRWRRTRGTGLPSIVINQIEAAGDLRVSRSRWEHAFRRAWDGVQSYWPEAIVVYPQGLPTPGIVMDFEGKKPGWQREPGQEHDRDLKFIDAILATLREKYSIDESRIYATGFSNGGLFTYLLLSQRANVFAAYAPSGSVLLPQVPLAQARPVFHYGGQSDRLARFDKQQATIDQLRKFNGCSAQGEWYGSNCTLYRSAKGAPVATFIHSGGHFYPPAVTPLIVKFFQD